MYTMCLQCPQRPEEGNRSPGTGIIRGCELSSRCWELNLNPLLEQLVLFIAEPIYRPNQFLIVKNWKHSEKT